MSKEKQAQQDTQSKTRINKPVQEEMRGMETAVTNPIPALQRAYTDPRRLSPADAKILQRTIGNQALGRLTIQRKMTVGPVGDKYEQEADAVAAKVVNKINAPTQTPTTQRQEEEELQMQAIVQRQEEEELQMKSLPSISKLQRQEEEELQMQPSSTTEGEEISTDIEGQIESAKGGGRPLSADTQSSMGQAFNANFSDVKVHTDGQADTLNRSLQARAFTTGQDIFFRSGEYNPDSSSGQTLLAHELTHTVQQGFTAQRTTVQRMTIRERIALLTNNGLKGEKESINKQKEAITKRIKDNYGIDLDQDAGINAIKASYSTAPAPVRNGLKARDWTLQELQDVETALSRYGALLGNKRDAEHGAQSVTSFSRLEQGIDEDSTGTTYELENTTAGETFTNNITMFDAGTTVSDFVTDKSNPTSQEHRMGFRGTIEHELSHALIENLKIGNSKKIIRRWVSEFDFWSRIFVAAYPTIQDAKDAGVEVPITTYGGDSAKEDLAEALMFYFEKPGALEANCPLRFKFIKDVIEPVLKPDENSIDEEEDSGLSTLFD